MRRVNYVFGTRQQRDSTHPKLSQLRDKRTPLVRKRQAIHHIFRARIKYIGWSAITAHRELNVPRDFVRDLIKGTPIKNQAYLQSVCDKLGIRYNHLPFEGNILTDLHDIISDIHLRCKTLEIDLNSPEFEYFCGWTYPDLIQELETNGVTQETYSTLTEIFKIRVWHPSFRNRTKPRRRIINEINKKEIIHEMRAWMDSLNINYTELAETLGTTKGMVARFFCYQDLNAGIAKTILTPFGYVASQPKKPKIDNLPAATGLHYLTPDLLSVIEAQLQVIGWTKARLEEHLGWNNGDLSNISMALKKTSDKRSCVTETFRQKMKDVCDALNIELYDFDNLPEIHVPSSLSIQEIIDRYLPFIREYRYKLGLRIECVLEALAERENIQFCTHTYIKIEQGQIKTQSREKFECLLRLFNIITEPFTAPLLIAPEDPVRLPFLKAHLVPRFKKTTASYETIRDITKETHDELLVVLAGRRSVSNQSTIKTCRLFNIQLPNDKHFEEFRKIDEQRIKVGLSIPEACDAIGISETDYYKIKCGTISLKSNIAQRMKTFLNAISWLNLIKTKIKQAGGIRAIAKELKFTPNHIQETLEGKKPLFSDEAIELAIHFEVIDTAMAQHIAELYVDDLDFVQSLQLDQHPGIILNPQMISNNIARRSELLIKQHHEETLTQEELEFLKSTGGDLNDLSQLTLWQILYRYSLGDTTTCCLAWIYQNMNPDHFASHYDTWLKENYNLNTQTKTFESIPGKPLPVVVEVDSFALMIDRLKPQSKQLAAR